MWSEKRRDLMGLIRSLGNTITRKQSLLAIQRTDSAVARINEVIVGNEQLDEKTIEALYIFLYELYKATYEAPDYIF